MWRGPGATFRSAQNYETPHIRHGLRPMTPSPRGEGFSLKPLSPTSNDRTLPPSPASPVSAYGIWRIGACRRPYAQTRQPLPSLIRPLRGHLPPGEGESQTGRQPSTKPNRTPPPAPSVPPPPTRREAALRWEDIRNHRQRGFPLPVVFYLLSRLYSLSFGKVTVMVVPLPRVESTWMVPRWIITACLTMDKPRPVPPTSLDRLLSTR